MDQRKTFGPDNHQGASSSFLASGGEGRTVGTLDRAAGILIRRLVQRPRLYEVGGMEDSGKQPRTGASRSRACFAPALLAQKAGETDDAAQLEPGYPLLPPDGAVGRIELKSEAFANPRSRRPESNWTISGLGGGRVKTPALK